MAVEEGLAVSRAVGDQTTLALALFQVSQAAWWRGEYAAARSLAEDGVAMSQAATAIVLEVLNGYVLANVLMETEEPVAALSLARRCRTLALEVGYTRGIAMALTTLGRAYFEEGNVTAARRLEQGLANLRATGFSYAVAWSLALLGWVAADEQDFARSRALLGESLVLRQQLGAHAHLAESLEGFARLAAATQQQAHALRLAGAADALRRKERTPLLLGHPRQLERWLAPARTARAPRVAAAAWHAGRSLSLEQAVACALEETRIGDGDSGREREGYAPL